MLSIRAMESLQAQTLNNTVGAAFLGVAAASMVYGINVLQTYWYYHSYPHDSRLHKFAVATLSFLDTFHSALTIHAVYVSLVTGFGDVLGLSHIGWSIKLQVSVNVIVTLLVHSLYAKRVWLLGGYHHGILGYLVAAVVAAGFGVGVVVAVLIYTIDSYNELDKISWAINSALATSTAIDFIICAAMSFYLKKSKGDAYGLNSQISLIMQFTLTSGLLTSACSLSAMFSYILLPNTFVFLAIEFLLTKLYVGSFLAMLNARERNKDAGLESSYSSEPKHIKVHVTSSFWSPTPPSPTSTETISELPNKDVPQWRPWTPNSTPMAI